MVLNFEDSSRFISLNFEPQRPSFFIIDPCPHPYAKRSSGIRRAIQAAIYEQQRILLREVKARDQAAIQPQAILPHVTEPHITEPHVAEPYVVEPQAIQQEPLEERVQQAVRSFNSIQDLYRKIPPQLLPPVQILAQQAAGNFQFQNAIQSVSPREDEDVLQLAYEDEA
ncbi:hypothetical protein GHT06_020439 [Daphnia sinensis]|uniref:Uncharacterized protein n=1 Tax=Daphnia sinensis TaxID=1820382 RepID=A0AAD5KYX5_9CRUS|nr:hypothetical protein GHT06_020439 [Daphnia sinensis]